MNSNAMKQKVILITGASRGIGLATATLLTQRGYLVFGTSRTPAHYTVSDFSLLQLDVNDETSVKQCVNRVLEQAGRIDILMNNAGYSLYGAVEEATVEDAKRLFETNFFGIMRMTNAVLPHMRQAGTGRIINIGSLAGIVGVPYIGIYAAAKHALEGYTASLRYELRGFGIYASIIDPGDIATAIVTEPSSNPISIYDGIRERTIAIHDENVRSGPPPEKVARAVLKVIESRAPRLRYTVTHREEFGVPWMKRLLPEPLIEWFIRSTYKLG
jgi:NAD(P)-dependent dehydrogenase (short-subunit alcohol dehydrogenase family)